uniref:Uncharacterized protein n=1 Tax=Xenopus tropicalis TaxID=8364 RepID=A0A6I8Q2W1_XENTR
MAHRWEKIKRTNCKTMQSVSIQPFPVGQTVTITQANDWDSGLCDCCDDCGICCLAFWCFPCFQCKTVSDFKECLCLPLLDPYLMGYIGCGTACPPISMAMRASVRERYKIPGSICDDCCMLCWCYSCSWCQMAREIKKRKQPFTFVTAQTTSVQMPLQQNIYPKL